MQTGQVSGHGGDCNGGSVTLGGPLGLNAFQHDMSQNFKLAQHVLTLTVLVRNFQLASGKTVLGVWLWLLV